MKSQRHAPSSAVCNQCCLLQAWCPRGLGWQVPFGWRTPQQVTLVPVPVVRGRRPVVFERLAAERQQGSSKGGRSGGCSGRKGLKLLHVARDHQKLSRLRLVCACVRGCVRGVFVSAFAFVRAREGALQPDL